MDVLYYRLVIGNCSPPLVFNIFYTIRSLPCWRVETLGRSILFESLLECEQFACLILVCNVRVRVRRWLCICEGGVYHECCEASRCWRKLSHVTWSRDRIWSLVSLSFAALPYRT